MYLSPNALVPSFQKPVSFSALNNYLRQGSENLQLSAELQEKLKKLPDMKVDLLEAESDSEIAKITLNHRADFPVSVQVYSNYLAHSPIYKINARNEITFETNRPDMEPQPKGKTSDAQRLEDLELLLSIFCDECEKYSQWIRNRNLPHPRWRDSF